MKILVTESQFKKLEELSFNSYGVIDFIEMVKENPKLLKFLGFSSIKSLKDFIHDGDGEDFDELKSDVDKFMNKNN